jgi:hypothetical protein
MHERFHPVDEAFYFFIIISLQSGYPISKINMYLFEIGGFYGN